MNKKIRDTPMRTDAQFKELLRKARKQRQMNFPNETDFELTDRELTRMLRNTDGFKQSLEELKKKPRIK